MALQGKDGLTEAELPQLRTETLVTGFSGTGAYLVVDDATAATLSVRRQIFVGNYAGDPHTAEAALTAALDSPNFYDTGFYNTNTKLQIYLENMGTKILVLFMGLYLGLVFLVTAAAVLALQQLSQAADNQPRYAILARLGAPENMRSRALFTQVFLSFFLPLALAVVHSVVGMTAANAVIASVGRVDSVQSSLVTAALLLVIYGAYFLATYSGARTVVRGNG